MAIQANILFYKMKSSEELKRLMANSTKLPWVFKIARNGQPYQIEGVTRWGGLLNGDGQRQANAELLAYSANSILELTERLEKAEKALEAVSTHYSASLDYQPPYVRIARETLKELRKPL